MADKLTEKQKRFADEYLIDLNAKQAAIRTGYSAKTAEVQGSRLLSNAKVKEYLEKRMKNKEKATIATQDEILEYLTKVMREEESQEVHDMFGNTFRRLPNINEKSKAAELLAKRYGLLTDKVVSDNTNHNENINFNSEEERRLYCERKLQELEQRRKQQ